jgi:CubicO group peptidase (beta-lactamase class C family)
MIKTTGIVLLLIFTLSGCKVGRFFIYNFADITDYQKFPKRELVKSETPFQFERLAELKKPKSFTVNGAQIDFDDYLEDNKTVSFLIIKNDTIHYEKYYNKYEKSSITTSFSMAKSITSMLVGFAIQDELIGSENDLVTQYIPELKEQGFDNVTLKHLLQMTSGLKFNESYINPFGHAATYYYGRKLRKTIANATLENEPGLVFNYTSGQSQILGLALERSLKGKKVTEYLQEKIWTPLGMEYDGSWSLDRKKNGLEKTFCCINARALDFAKLGRFYLNEGEWQGEQLLNKAWIEKSTKIETIDGSSAKYQYQWWLKGDQGEYMAQGILGQYIYIHPKKKLIIIRMGKIYGNTNWPTIFNALSKAY